jgi:hypothetical protein
MFPKLLQLWENDAEGGLISSLKLIDVMSDSYALAPLSTLKAPFNPPQRT